MEQHHTPVVVETREQQLVRQREQNHLVALAMAFAAGSSLAVAITGQSIGMAFSFVTWAALTFYFWACATPKR